LKLIKSGSALVFTALILMALSCSQKKVKDHSAVQPENNSSNGENLFSEKFKRTGWINSTRYRAVIHILTYDQCISYEKEILKDNLEMRAFRNLRNELGTAGSREADVQILNLIKNNGIILRPDLTCTDINIYYFDINKKNLTNDFKYIQSLK